MHIIRQGFFATVICIFFFVFADAQTHLSPYHLVKIEAAHEHGFNYPYYLFIPDTLMQAVDGRISTLLVVPNNSGFTNDTLAAHEEVVKKQILIFAKIADTLPAIILMPVFPRPRKQDNIYTHALDRDALLTNDAAFLRFDLQLIAMIADARKRLTVKNLVTTGKVWMTGFSASGMFTNRFCFLHPEIVKAAAIGSPGGWPIAPAGMYGGEKLRYPIGINDIKLLTGKDIDMNELKKLRLFIYMGDADDNDSVVYPDGYDPEDKDLVFRLFGDTPISRWERSKKLYSDAKLNATFKLYPGIKHTLNNDMIRDIVAFFRADQAVK